MYENTREPPGVVGGVGWSGIGESGEDPGGGGGTLNFSTYVGSDLASTLHPPKNIRNFKHTK